MDKAVNVILGFFALPIALGALAAAWPDLHGGENQIPATDVLLLRPGAPDFVHVPLHAPNLQPDVAVEEDGTLFVVGNVSERFDPATSRFQTTTTPWLQLEVHAPLGFNGTSWLVAPSTFFGIIPATDGSPQTLKTAIATNHVWKDGPIFPENDLVYDAARLDDGTIALAVQEHRIWIARPDDSAFHDAKVDTELPNGQLWAFGKGLIHIAWDQRMFGEPSHLRTRLIDVETHHATPGPALTFPPSDNVEFKSGGLPNGAALVVALTTKRQAFNRDRLPINIAGAVVFAIDVAGIIAYLRRKRRSKGEATWMIVGGLIALALAGGAVGLLWLAFRNVHW